MGDLEKRGARRYVVPPDPNARPTVNEGGPRRLPEVERVRKMMEIGQSVRVAGQVVGGA